MLAERLWTNGWEVENIAARGRADVSNIENYLASRSLISGLLAPRFDAALDRTIGPFVAREERRSRLTLVTIDRRGTPSGAVDIYTHLEMTCIGGMRYVDKRRERFHGIPARLENGRAHV